MDAATTKGTEKRQARRYPFLAPVQIEWQENNHLASGMGVIRDMSTAGVYFYGTREWSLGDRLQLKLQLRATPKWFDPVHLVSVGTVCRVEKAPVEYLPVVGVAISFDAEGMDITAVS